MKQTIAWMNNLSLRKPNVQLPREMCIYLLVTLGTVPYTSLLKHMSCPHLTKKIMGSSNLPLYTLIRDIYHTHQYE
jgi:hypothetical protein